MPDVTTPYELFLHQLGAILYVEEKLVAEALPKSISQVDDDELRSTLEEHLDQTRRHVENIERCFELLGESPAPMGARPSTSSQRNTTSWSKAPPGN
jgi:ferritin-like metal-binding protein YciE